MGLSSRGAAVISIGESVVTMSVISPPASPCCGSVDEASGDDSMVVVGSVVFRPSSSSSPSSSASLESLSDSSLIASLTLSKTSTLADADATGRARRPRITA